MRIWVRVERLLRHQHLVSFGVRRLRVILFILEHRRLTVADANVALGFYRLLVFGLGFAAGLAHAAVGPGDGGFAHRCGSVSASAGELHG